MFEAIPCEDASSYRWWEDGCGNRYFFVHFENILWLCWSIIRTVDAKVNDWNEWGDEDGGWWRFLSPLVKSHNHFFIWIIMWCVKWMIVMVVQSRHARRCHGGTPLRFFFFLLLLSPPDWRYASRISYYIWLKITFREMCNFVYNCAWSLHLNRFDRFLIFGAYLWGFRTIPFSST